MLLKTDDFFSVRKSIFVTAKLLREASFSLKFNHKLCLLCEKGLPIASILEEVQEADQGRTLVWKDP